MTTQPGGLPFKILCWNVILIVCAASTEASVTADLPQYPLIGFTIAPQPSPLLEKSTWQWYFDELNFVKGPVSDVCDAFTRLLANVSAVYHARLLTCQQQPWDRPADDETTVDLYFNAKHFNQTHVGLPCMFNIAAELQAIIHLNLPKSERENRRFRVEPHQNSPNVFAVKLQLELNKTDLTEKDLRNIQATLTPQARFEAMLDLRKRWLSADLTQELLATHVHQAFPNFRYADMVVRMFFKEANHTRLQLLMKEALEFEPTDNPPAEQTITVKRLRFWALPFITEPDTKLLMPTVVCTTLVRKRVHVFNIKGPIHWGQRISTNPYELEKQRAVETQILEATEDEFSKPSMITLVSTYSEEENGAIYRVYFDSIPVASVDAALRRQFQGASKGFSDDAVITSDVEECWVSDFNIDINDYHVQASVYRNDSPVVWETMPSVSSEKYQSLRKNVIEYFMNITKNYWLSKTIIQQIFGELYLNEDNEVQIDVHIVFDYATFTRAQTCITDRNGQGERAIHIPTAFRALAESKNSESEVQISTKQKVPIVWQTRVLCGNMVQLHDGFHIQNGTGDRSETGREYFAQAGCIWDEQQEVDETNRGPSFLQGKTLVLLLLPISLTFV